MDENSTKQFSYDLDFEDYLIFIKENIPKSLFITDGDNKILFFSINNAYKLCDILTDFELIISDCNYFNLLNEYKKYFARLLSTICLNDAFLINNILRLLVEKLYRILTGIYYPLRGERRIRSDSRSNMSNDLESMIEPNIKTKLDALYSNLSNSIHHTLSNNTDMYDIRRIFSTRSTIVADVLRITNELNGIFLSEVFLKVCLNKKNIIGTNFKINIQNNLTNDITQKITTCLAI